MTSDFEDLAVRLRRLEDLAAIHQLFIDYGAYLDRHDFDSYASLFAEEGELLLGPLGRAKGREAIRTLMEKALGQTPAGQSFHVISNPVVTIDGDGAQAEVMWTVVQRDPDGRPKLSMIGRHRDELTRQDGRWYFWRRAGHVDIPSRYPGS